jgi:hypothetical protein
MRTVLVGDVNHLNTAGGVSYEQVGSRLQPLASFRYPVAAVSILGSIPLLSEATGPSCRTGR